MVQKLDNRHDNVSSSRLIVKNLRSHHKVHLERRNPRSLSCNRMYSSTPLQEHSQICYKSCGRAASRVLSGGTLHSEIPDIKSAGKYPFLLILTTFGITPNRGRQEAPSDPILTINDQLRRTRIQVKPGGNIQKGSTSITGRSRSHLRPPRITGRRGPSDHSLHKSSQNRCKVTGE